MKSAAFLCGIGVGLVAGAALEMMVYPQPTAMKASVDKTMQKAGIAIDHAADTITSALGQ